MQIKGQWQAGMWLQAILVSVLPRALIQASESQFVFLHELLGQDLAEIKHVWKNISAMRVNIVRSQMQLYGSGSCVAKSNLRIIIYKREPNCALFAQYLVSPNVDKLI